MLQFVSRSKFCLQSRWNCQFPSANRQVKFLTTYTQSLDSTSIGSRGQQNGQDCFRKSFSLRTRRWNMTPNSKEQMHVNSLDLLPLLPYRTRLSSMTNDSGTKWPITSRCGRVDCTSALYCGDVSLNSYRKPSIQTDTRSSSTQLL